MVEVCGCGVGRPTTPGLETCKEKSDDDGIGVKFIRFTNLQSCTIIKYSSSTTHVRFELDLTSTLPVLIRVLSTDHVGIKYRSSLDRD